MSERLTIPQEHVDWRTKGVWWPEGSLTLEEFAQQAGGLFSGPFTWPLMVLREPELTRNITALADFTEHHGLTFAPHGKTSMAPALIQRQLDAGAWGVTAATANQVLAYRRFGVQRIVLANELLDTRALSWIVGELGRDPGFEFLFYADSPEGVAAAASAAAPGGRPLRVLVERGVPGGRTGCRDRAGLLAVAEEVYEQVLSHRIFPGARELLDQHLADGDQVWIVTAAPREVGELVARRLNLTGVTIQT